MSDQTLERFHRALIEEIQTQRPEYLTQPFTVAEIYQNLVPYGSHRDRIGVEMNGDYEDALVRLLAGEGGYLILDSEPALRGLQAELDGPNPNTGVYREFAAVDVRLNQAYLDLSADALDQLPDLVEELEAEDPVTMADLAPAEGHATASDMGAAPSHVDIFSDAPEPGGLFVAANGASDMTDASVDHASVDLVEAKQEPADEAESTDEEPERVDESDPAPSRASARPPLEPEYVEAQSEPTGEVGPGEGSCVWCRADLPDRENLNFCPYCGTDVTLIPCPACGEEVEAGWRFCIACGTEVRD